MIRFWWLLCGLVVALAVLAGQGCGRRGAQTVVLHGGPATVETDRAADAVADARWHQDLQAIRNLFDQSDAEILRLRIELAVVYSKDGATRVGTGPGAVYAIRGRQVTKTEYDAFMGELQAANQKAIRHGHQAAEELIRILQRPDPAYEPYSQPCPCDVGRPLAEGPFTAATRYLSPQGYARLTATR